MRELHLGDNLAVLRRRMPDASVDLVYLDPPFNSNRAYHLLPGKTPDPGAEGRTSAFDDIWAWDDGAAQAWAELLDGGDARVATCLTALRELLGESPMMAYLAMMARRLVEIRRAMKPTASLYLHCDGSASHYLKVLLDGLFGAENFRNEVIWYYYNKYSAGRRAFARNFDQILFYSRGEDYVFQPLREARGQPRKQLLRENVGGVLKNRKGPDGKVLYREVTDKKVDAVWRIPCLQPASHEMLGYPTQKPLALLERIVAASSRPGDVVLDPFCGCGTAVHAAEKLGRGWIGIDASRIAVRMVRERMAEAFPGLEIDFRDAGDPDDGTRVRIDPPTRPLRPTRAAVPAAARG